MSAYNADPVAVDVLWQGEGNPHQVRLEMPDGDMQTGSLDFDSMLDRLATLEQVWLSGEPDRYGQALFRHLFADELSYYFGAAQKAAGERGIRLLLRLDMRDPRLHLIPWERLYLPQGNRWEPLSAIPNVYFSRYLAGGGRWGLPVLGGPLRMLIAISAPYRSGHALHISAKHEQAALAQTLDKFSEQIDYEFLDSPVTLEAIAEKLEAGEGFDVLYFMGHGVWKAEEEATYLVLEKIENGSLKPSRVSEQDLIARLRLVRHLPRLICLAACESAQQPSPDALAGLGPKLVLAGCPAVLCMQGCIEVEIAEQFTHQVLTQLLKHGFIDVAVNRARQGVHERWAWQWAIPVLFMRLPNGLLFRPQQRFQPAILQPYRGLMPYTAAEWDLFFGRSDDIQRVYHRICENPVTIIYGEAGVGLTSLLGAGLQPRLEKARQLVIPVSTYNNLTAAVRANLQDKGRPIRLHIPGDAPLAEVLSAACAEVAATYDRLVLVLDQFERAFEQGGESPAAIIAALADSLTMLGNNLRLVFGIHADHRDPLLDRLKDLAPEIIQVEPLAIPAAERAVVEPLSRLNWPVNFSPQTLAQDDIVPDLAVLSGQPNRVDPGYLQIVCNRLYLEALKPKMTHAISDQLYDSLRRAKGIMAGYVDEVLMAIGTDRTLAEQILAQVAADGIGHWTPLEGLAVAGNSVKQEEVLAHLVEANLLVEQHVNGRREYTLTNRAIAERATRLQASEDQRKATAELDRILDAWLARDVLATRGQLGYLNTLTEAGARLELDLWPDKALLLLKSALKRDDDIQPWFEQLRHPKGICLIEQLEGCQLSEGCQSKKQTEWEDREAKQMIAQVLDIHAEPRPPLPETAANTYGNIAWTAVTHHDPVVRQTAALALATLQPAQALNRLRCALEGWGAGWRRRERNAELRAIMAEARPGIERGQAKLSRLDRVWIYGWRIRRYIWRTGHRVVWLSLGGAIGAGIGLGLLRGGTATLLSAAYTPRLQFAIHVWWGIILGAALVLGLLSADALLLGRREISPAKGSHRYGPALLTIGLTALYFSLGQWVIAWLIDRDLASSQGWAEILYGLLVGLGLGLALHGLPDRYRQWGVGHRILRLGAATLGFVLAQLPFAISGKESSSLAVVWGSGRYLTDFPRYLNWASRLENNVPRLFDILGLLDAALVGLVLAVGTTAGLLLADRWLAQWQMLKNRAGD